MICFILYCLKIVTVLKNVGTNKTKQNTFKKKLHTCSFNVARRQLQWCNVWKHQLLSHQSVLSSSSGVGSQWHPDVLPGSWSKRTNPIYPLFACLFTQSNNDIWRLQRRSMAGRDVFPPGSTWSHTICTSMLHPVHLWITCFILALVSKTLKDMFSAGGCNSLPTHWEAYTILASGEAVSHPGTLRD